MSEGTDWIAGTLRHDSGVRTSWRTSLHAKLIALVAFASLIAAPAAFAMPGLLEGSGALSAEYRNALLGVGILVGWIALALLLPDFDGRHDEDWGGDQEEWKPF
jgi:hypothetical protein